MKNQAAWLVRGQAHTESVLDEHAAAIQELQRQVHELTEIVHRIAPITEFVGEQWEHLPRELRSVVDDLSQRISALDRRLEERGS